MDDSVQGIDLLFWCGHFQRQHWVYYVTASRVPCHMNTTSWVQHKTANSVSHEYRMQWQLECHIFGIMLTAMNSGRR